MPGPPGRPGRRARRRADARAPRAARPRAAGSAPLVLPEPPIPTAQYVQAVAAGSFLFVSGHDPEIAGRLAYRGRVGRSLSGSEAAAAVRLATLNALASARAAVGSWRRVRRAVVLTCFVDAVPGALDPGITREAVALVAECLGPARPPVVWLRPAHSLAGGMPVEVELLLELVTPRRRQTCRQT